MEHNPGPSERPNHRSSHSVASGRRRRDLSPAEKLFHAARSVGVLSAAALAITTLTLVLVLNSTSQSGQASAAPLDVADNPALTARQHRQQLSRAAEQHRLALAAQAVQKVDPGMSVVPAGRIKPTFATAKSQLVTAYDKLDMNLVPETSTTAFKVGSYNLLGFDHTGRRGNKPGWQDGYARMSRSTALIRNTGSSVVGLQEAQIEQVNYFRNAMPNWGIFPGTSMERKASQNSIVWDTAVWEVVETHTIVIPYFHWEPFPMPYVLLRHKESGREVWFANFHNPASVRGPAAGIRHAAVTKEAALANRLQATGTPVVFTGDFNDKAPFFCQISAATNMHGSNGSQYDDGCQLAGPQNIDWVIASPDVSFTEHVVDNYPRASGTSDHPMIRAIAQLSPPSERDECKSEKVESRTLYFCPDPDRDKKHKGANNSTKTAG